MRVNFRNGLAVAACQRSGSAGIGVGRCPVLRRAPARRLAYLHADDAGDADVNAGPGFLGALCGGRRHFISERRNRKKSQDQPRRSRFWPKSHRYFNRHRFGPCANNPNAGCSFLEKCRMLPVPNETLRLGKSSKRELPGTRSKYDCSAAAEHSLWNPHCLWAITVWRARETINAPGSDAQTSAILTMPDYFFAQTPDPA